MNYVSTRGKAPVLGFDDVLLAGLARDGGLYVPEAWPAFSPGDMRDFGRLSYPELAVRVMAPFMGGRADGLEAIVAEAYRNFDHADVAPLKELAPGEWLLELFHGPTLAFKDHSLQFMGPLFDRVLGERGERITVIGATSGDTGSAAIEACRDRDSIEIFILHPEGRVSEFQRRQMTTVPSANVHNIAIEGTFDDCQGLVKAMFNDPAFRHRHKLAAFNSINWVRIMAQIVYYFRAATLLGAPDSRVAFAVPTGNFGNVFAAYAAHRMGLPISQLVVGSNRNDILTRFFRTGRMETGAVHPTISPSMDIQVSSNFERLLFELLDRDHARIAALMEGFSDSGGLRVSAGPLARARELFDGKSFDDDQTRATIKAVYEETGRLIDPHTAVGVAAGRALKRDPGSPMVFVATAHAAKFGDAVEAAAGVRPRPPARLDGLMEREERCRVLANDLAKVQGFITGRLAERVAA
ncbi:MAG: threonine synthase [Proteobacteria bacterium]|nr:threonine synthase [Pseudomonadota bacterium]